MQQGMKNGFRLGKIKNICKCLYLKKKKQRGMEKRVGEKDWHFIIVNSLSENVKTGDVNSLKKQNGSGKVSQID